ncbi:hypothetical protein [Acidiphilium sp.]|uniref:hypothetical protein n=1 Tax=Acidiphilium sp. TaxID=527 RepID=UPI002584685A|nr:hypothetical protein [Acidiphilium sp.]
MISWPAVWAWLKGVPKEIWIFICIAVGVFVIRQDAAGDARREAELKRRKAEDKARREAEAQARAIIKEEKTHADDARDAAARPGRAEPEPSGGMSDAKRRYIFGRARTAGRAGANPES